MEVGRIKAREVMDVLVIGLLVRLLLIPAYFSTDFDVHRNWLRITYNQPLTNWYVDTKSQWTLDYPPFFAYFQYFLSHIASIFSPAITNSDYLECQTNRCVLFQRITVIVSQLVYLAGLLYCLKGKTSRKRLLVLFLQYGFVLLDDVHFQYNSMMQGILLISIQLILDGRTLLGAFVFSVLLNLKHIYLYAAPVYFLYILSQYVMGEKEIGERIKRLVKVGAVVMGPFVVSFGPFIIKGGLQQIPLILGRLFPFGRGLVHSYWAPNFWAFYSALDRVLAFLFQQRIYLIEGYRQTLRVLPEVSPSFSLILVLLSSLPLYKQCFFQSSNKMFVKHLVLCGLLFCFFGYHVHQKAFLVYINLALVFGGDEYWDEVFVSSVSVMPLLHRAYERVAKVLGLGLYMSFWRETKHKTPKSSFITVTGLLILLYHEVLHPFTTLRYYFLPLMMYSLWAAFWYLLLILKLYREGYEERQFKVSPHEYSKIEDEEEDGSKQTF